MKWVDSVQSMELRPRGRPFDESMSEALLQAAERVMVNEGFSALTIDGLVKEVGTTRPTFYRRFRNVSYIIFEVLRRKFNLEEFESAGGLRADILKLQRDEVAMFSGPLLQKNLPGLLETIRTNSDLAELYLTQFIRPRRERVVKAIDAAVERGEIVAPATSVEFICDLLLGPIMARALLPGTGPLDDQLARDTAEVAVSKLC